MNHRFSDEAETDLEDVTFRYDIAAGCGKDFVFEVMHLVSIIEANPQGFARAPGSPRGREVRVVKIGRFDYLLYHEVLPTELVTIAVTHASRNDRGGRKQCP